MFSLINETASILGDARLKNKKQNKKNNDNVTPRPFYKASMFLEKKRKTEKDPGKSACRDKLARIKISAANRDTAGYIPEPLPLTPVQR